MGLFSGVVLVTTPQPAALQVTQRGANMYKKLNVPIIGLVENMCTIQCPNCKQNVSLYDSETDKLVRDLNISILIQLNIDKNISMGKPVIISHPTSKQSEQFINLANSVADFIKI